MAPRMRTIGDTVRWLRVSDPDTALTETAIRRMVVSGELPGVVKVGAKYLLNLDVLTEFLRGSGPVPAVVQKAGMVEP